MHAKLHLATLPIRLSPKIRGWKVPGLRQGSIHLFGQFDGPPAAQQLDQRNVAGPALIVPALITGQNLSLLAKQRRRIVKRG